MPYETREEARASATRAQGRLWPRRAPGSAGAPDTLNANVAAPARVALASDRSTGRPLLACSRCCCAHTRRHRRDWLQGWKPRCWAVKALMLQSARQQLYWVHEQRWTRPQALESPAGLAACPVTSVQQQRVPRDPTMPPLTHSCEAAPRARTRQPPCHPRLLAIHQLPAARCASSDQMESRVRAVMMSWARCQDEQWCRGPTTPSSATPGSLTIGAVRKVTEAQMSARRTNRRSQGWSRDFGVLVGPEGNGRSGRERLCSTTPAS